MRHGLKADFFGAVGALYPVSMLMLLFKKPKNMAVFKAKLYSELTVSDFIFPCSIGVQSVAKKSNQ